MAKRNVKIAKRPQSVNIRMKQIRAKVKPEINVVLKQHQALRRAVTKKWSAKNKPKFPKFFDYAQTPNKTMKFGVIVDAPNANQAGISVYRMLNDDRGGGMATKVRRVKLNKDWDSKTRPRSFGTYGKGGHVVGMFTKEQARRLDNGIESREWDELAKDILNPMLTERIKKGYESGFKTVQGKTINGR